MKVKLKGQAKVNTKIGESIPMPTTPKDIHSLDYSDVDSLADYVCEAMFLDKNQHKKFFRTLFDKCAIAEYERGYRNGYEYGRNSTVCSNLKDIKIIDPPPDGRPFCSLPSFNSVLNQKDWEDIQP